MQRKMTKAEFLLFTVYINFWEVLILVLIVHIYELSISTTFYTTSVKFDI